MFIDFFKNLIKGETYLGLLEALKKRATLENMILLRDNCWNGIKSIINKFGKIIIITIALLVLALVCVGVSVYIIFMIISGIFKTIAYCCNWISEKIDMMLKCFKNFVIFVTNKINGIANPEKVKEFEKLLKESNSVTTISPEVIKEVINAAKEEANKKVEG